MVFFGSLAAGVQFRLPNIRLGEWLQLDQDKRMKKQTHSYFPILMTSLLVAFLASATIADEVTIKKNGEEQTLIGKVVVEAQDGGLLFQTRDSALWVIEADQVVSKSQDDGAIEPLTADELGESLLAELPDGFRIYTTEHFVIAYQTEKVYARWVGGLYERLFKGFEKYWESKKKLELEQPQFPLVAIVFGSRAEYARYVQRELGTDPGTMVAYYNLMTNRVAMYDLTADQVQPGTTISNDRRVNQILSSPNSLPMVATVIHEGTHQLMFNRGMQTRFSDTPLWLNEGLAMYFETPDMKSSRGWRAIGRVNPLRFGQFRQDLQTRAPNALTELISHDKRFADAQHSGAAYAESWALNYYLLNRRSDEYVAYLKFMAKKRPLEYDTPEQRLSDFKQFFGEDLNALDREFVGYMLRLN